MPLTFLAKETSGNARTTSLKIQHWKTEANEGDIVQFENSNGSDLTVTIVIPDGLFTVNGNVGPLAPRDPVVEREVATGTAGKEYKYSVEAELSEGDSFTYDPRFIIGG